MNIPIPEIVQAQHQGRAVGVYSVCSSHPFVLEAALLQARNDGTYLLIESTSNQVDQFGGYTGMSPADFVAYVQGIADRLHFPRERVWLGGDHLGPNPWKDQPARKAMDTACDLVDAYVRAGFTKIHLDASMRCADDPGSASTPLPDEIVAERAAQLCAVAEAAFAAAPADTPPVYVIGTEVPIPGGATSSAHEIEVTSPEAAERTIEANRRAFCRRGLEAAWERVVALVVQPGVEFGDDEVVEYSRPRAVPLSQMIEAYPRLVFEAHSTDYQQPGKLAELVRDHFAILKVGPALTFACREALFGLEAIEVELAGRIAAPLSRLRETLEQAMLSNPGHWARHYAGDEIALRLARRYSYSDRSRYYWPVPTVNHAVQQLLSNLQGLAIPATLLSQFLSAQYEAMRAGAVANAPLDLVLDRIRGVLSVYARACLQ